jgi:beta-lactamase class A
MTISKHFRSIIISCGIFLLGVTTAVIIRPALHEPPHRGGMTYGESVNLFTNPTVTDEEHKHFIINFKVLRDEFIKIQSQYSQKTYIYFAYLNNSSWVGRGEKELITAASTVKVPLAMAVMRAVEQGEFKLTDSYTLEELDLDDRFGQLYQAGPDNEFTLEELMRIMLVNSDNTAMNALFNVFKRIGVETPLTDVYTAMGWDYPPRPGDLLQYVKINLKYLSNMFLSLYNAQYVSDIHSNQILDYLSQSPFDNQLVAGVPKDVLVSHKIGVSTDDMTYTDCGIVYAPNRNYILCVSSQGVPQETAAKFIVAISKAAYNFVISH